MAIQSIITGDIKIRELNGVLIANNGIVDSTSFGALTSGTSGTSGSSGTSGVDGTSGTAGTSGTSGIDGTSGTSGVNGTSGTSALDGTSGTSGTAGTSGAGVANYYATYSNSFTESATLANTAYIINFDTVEIQNGISIVGGNKITVQYSGIYEVGFSPMVEKTLANGQLDVSFWLRVNGVDVPRSNSMVGLENPQIYSLPYVATILSLNQGDYIELFFSATKTGVQLVAQGIQISPDRPATPSVILDIKNVGVAAVAYTSTSGTSGTSGIDGTSGINGTSGTSGINGTSGTSGIDGTSGLNGTSGTSGLNGTSGTSGINVGSSAVIIAGSGTCSSVRCGVSNAADATFSAALSGSSNAVASGAYASVISGGQVNTIGGSSLRATIGGGCCNYVSGSHSTVSGGRRNSIFNSQYASILGGYSNTVSSNAPYSSVGGGSVNSVFCSRDSVISGGRSNIILGNCDNEGRSFVGGGCNNIICQSYNSSIVGGLSNTLGYCGENGYSNRQSNIVGGLLNRVRKSPRTSVVNGFNNRVRFSCDSVITGGLNNYIRSCGFYGEGSPTTKTQGNFIGAGICNRIYSTPYSGVYSSFNAIPSGAFNCLANTKESVIAGGYFNRMYNSNRSSILNGAFNYIYAGYNNAIIGNSITISGCQCLTRVNTLSKTSGSFAISHPDPSKTAYKELWHSFVESPTAGDNIYRFTVRTQSCEATLKLPDYYKYLNKDTQVWVAPKDNFGAAHGQIDSSEENINIKSNEDGIFNVLVIGTRKDKDAVDSWHGVERNKQN